MFPPGITRYLIHPLRCRVNGYHRQVRAHGRDLARSEWWATERLMDLQVEKLRTLMEQAGRYSPYYKKLLQQAGLDPAHATHRDLELLPSLDKSTLRSQFEEIVSRRYERDRLIQCSSGGSTGDPVHVLQSGEMAPMRGAITERGYRWTGWFPGASHHKFWGAQLDVEAGTDSWRKRVIKEVYNKELVNAYMASEELFASYYSRYCSRPPALFESYADILYEFARYIEAQSLPFFGAGAIVSSAGTLHDFQRELIVRTVGREVFNRYGCREVGNIAQECEAHGGMHVNMERYIVEVSNPDAEGVGELLITDLENLAFPLVRYRIGDLGKLANKPCSCGRGLVVLERVVGRTVDVVMTPDGRRISGVLFPRVFRDFPQIVLGQVIQHSLTEVEVRLRLQGDMSEDDRVQLMEQLRRSLGSEVVIKINYDAEIVVTPTGKYRTVISHVGKASE